MGEAKRRGTLEQRQAEALAKREERLQKSRTDFVSANRQDEKTKIRRGLLLAAALTALSGCAMFGAPTGMSADQLSAYAKDKNSSAVCWTVLGPGWTSHVVAVNFDETRYAGGSITVNPDCAATITSEVVPAIPRPARVPPVVVAPPVVPAPTVGPATSPLPPFVPAVTYAMSSDGNCIRTERDSSGRVTGAATVDRARCQ